MKLIVGLGNPGAQYVHHRHNVGFWLLDQLCASGWAKESKFKAEIAKTKIVGEDRWLMKPSTFMNASGEAVGAFVRFHRLQPQEVLVVHDELDLPPGGVRLKQGGGHGGHNGVRDIELHLSSPNFWRLRIGIGHPRTLGLSQDVAAFVLNAPRIEEKTAIDRAIEESVKALPQILGGEITAAQRTLHSL